MRGFSQGLNRLRNDKEFSMKVLSKYTKVSDSETLAQLHQTYGVRYSGDRIPYVRAEGVDEILKRTPGKEAREAKAGDFVDNSLLERSRTERLVQNLGSVDAGCHHRRFRTVGAVRGSGTVYP